MKKFYTLIAIIIVGSFSVTAQISRRTTSGKTHAPQVKHANSNPAVNARVTPVNHSAAVFWTDDFANPSNWVISHAAGTSGDWTIGTTPPSGSFAIGPILSATAANNFAIFDSDLLCTGNQIADLTTTSGIDCSTHPTVRLTFSQYYKRFWDSTYVFVSTNGSTWTRFEVNGNLVLNDYSAGNIAINPDIYSVDITSVAGGQASVYIRFEFYSPSSIGVNAGCAYAWMIDDVSLADVPANDVKVMIPAYPGAYSYLPVIQTQGFSMGARIINSGGATATNVSMIFDVFQNNISNNVFTGVSDPVASMNPGDTSNTLAPTTSYVPTDTGIYVIRYVSSLSGDGDPSNDTTYTFVYVNDSIYARDYTSIDPNDYLGGYGFNSNTGAMGQMYHVYQASQFTSTTFYLGNGILGDSIKGEVYTISGGLPDALVATTGTYILTGADTGGAFITLPYQSPANVIPGDYMVTLSQLDTVFFGLGASSGIYTPGTAFYRTAAGVWHPIEDVPFRLAFILQANNPSSTLVGISTQEKNSSLIVYPNPSKGVVHLVNTGATEKNVEVSVVDAMGKIVLVRKFATLVNEKIDLTNQPDGIYTVQVKTSNNVIAKTIVISGQ